MLQKEGIVLTARPTTPSPNTATVEPSFTFAVFHAAPTPMFTFKKIQNSAFQSHCMKSQQFMMHYYLTS